MKLFLAILILALLPLQLLAKPYGEYRKDRCEWCNGKGSILNALNVHHILPQHERPDLKDSPDNLVTLCRRCHLVLGHKNNWTNSVPEIKILFRKSTEGK